jgi:hypothetical protein
MEFNHLGFCQACNTEILIKKQNDDLEQHRELVLKYMKHLKENEEKMYKVIALMMTRTGIFFDDDYNILFNF